VNITNECFRSAASSVNNDSHNAYPNARGPL